MFASSYLFKFADVFEQLFSSLYHLQPVSLKKGNEPSGIIDFFWHFVVLPHEDSPLQADAFLPLDGDPIALPVTADGAPGGHRRADQRGQLVERSPAIYDLLRR